jgi:hypothetical protein
LASTLALALGFALGLGPPLGQHRDGPRSASTVARSVLLSFVERMIDP